MISQILTKATLFRRFSTRGFQAVNNSEIRDEILKQKSDKLDALVDVVLSLNNKQLTYLNALQTQHQIENGNSVIQNKIFSSDGSNATPLQYAYQENWIKKNWKETHLLTSILVSEDDQDAGQEEEEVVKEIWEIELTSVEASQKIKIIKVLREMFSLGLKEAKEIADKTPSIIKRERKDEADKIKETLQKQGCVITLK